jgi:RES domain-containing protein
MEMLVHLGRADMLNLFMSIPVSFDDELCRWLDLTDLPADWASDPAPSSTRALGSKWADDASSAVLAVPSAIVHIETIFVVNPRHLDLPKITIGDASEFRFDSRLLKTGP